MRLFLGSRGPRSAGHLHGERLGVVAFDDERAVANAGVMLPALLVGRLGIERLVDGTVCLGDGLGGASAGRKVMTMVSAVARGAGCIASPW